MFAPLVLILPGAEQPATGGGREPSIQLSRSPPAWQADDAYVEVMTESVRIPGVFQVRIEQQTTVRVAPRSTAVRRGMIVERRSVSRIVERKIGRCLPITGLGGVEVEAGNSMILYLRDRRVVRAQLERSCRARDFYSGFYLAANDDGKVCVGRDTLLSRSGANCRLTRIRQLVEE